MKRTRILTCGDIDNLGAEFQMDEEPDTHMFKGKKITGLGIWKITRSNDGVGKDEVLYDVKERALDALTRFAQLERQVNSGQWKDN